MDISILGGCTNAFAIFGLVTASYFGIKCVGSLWIGLRAYILAAGVDWKKMGSWAAVTGATDGIGKAYAHELAKKGLNVVLISRNPDKLSDVAAEIEHLYKVSTKCVAVDFSGGPEIYEKVREALKDLEIGVLVNNVGLSYENPEFFADLPNDQKLHDIINVNVTSLTRMTRLLLPSMLERKKGVIINIASASGFRPTALLTQYSAAKAYVDFFSTALQVEYGSKGIIIQCVMPMFVATKMSKIRKANMFVPTPTTYARSALGTVGVQDRTFGCISHEIQALLFYKAAPDWLFNRVVLQQMNAARKRALTKLQKTQ